MILETRSPLLMPLWLRRNKKPRDKMRWPWKRNEKKSARISATNPEKTQTPLVIFRQNCSFGRTSPTFTRTHSSSPHTLHDDLTDHDREAILRRDCSAIFLTLSLQSKRVDIACEGSFVSCCAFDLLEKRNEGVDVG